jgi:hypothetical protein
MGRETGNMTADDRDYFLRRASEEDVAALAAASLAARWRHEELASLYRTRVLVFDRTIIEEEAAGIVEPFILVPASPQTAAA